MLPNSLVELNLDGNFLSATTEEWLDDNLEAPRSSSAIGLKKLTLKGNSFDTLESLSGIETIRGLEYLDLRDNRISNFGVLLACVPWGSSDKLTIRLEGNHFDEGQVENLYQIIKNFPQLILHLDCLEDSISKLDRVEFTPSIVTRSGGLLLEGSTRTESFKINATSVNDRLRKVTETRTGNTVKPGFHLDTLETADTLCDTSEVVSDQKRFVEESNHLMEKLGGWINNSNETLANLIAD